MAVWEFRRFKAVSWRSMRLEWSYRRKSRLDFMVFLYRWSMVSSLCTLFVWITFWSAEVRSRMGWSAVGRGRWTLIGEVWVASLLLSASSRLRTWLVGVQQIMHWVRLKCRVKGGGGGSQNGTVRTRLAAGKRGRFQVFKFLSFHVIRGLLKVCHKSIEENTRSRYISIL